MGRPIKKKFFGTTVGGASLAGGEGVSSLVVNGANSFSAGTTISFAASPIGGTTAAASITFYTPSGGAPGNGNVASTSITTAGTGYTSAPAVTFVKPGNVVVTGTITGGPTTLLTVSSTTGLFVGMVANAFFGTFHLGNPTRITGIYTGNNVVIMTNANTAAITSPISFGDVGREGSITAVLAAAVTTGNTIQGNAWITGGVVGSQADIVSQRSSRRYRVTNANGTNVVRLPKATETGLANTYQGPFAEGIMTISATDSTGGTYWVTKIDSRTATITPGGSGPGTQFTANAQVIWSMNAAVLNTTVKLATND